MSGLEKPDGPTGQPARKGPDPCHDLIRCERLCAGCVSSG